MSVAATDLIRILHEHHLRVFSTLDMLTLSGLSRDAGSHALKRLEAQGLLTRIKRGLWVNRLAIDFNPYEAVPYLTSPWPSCISLYSALADYGIVAEIPHVIYAVSSAPTRKYRTPVGHFHSHHLPGHLMFGFEMKRTGHGSYPMAEPEKAFLDTVYLALIPRSPIRLPHKRSKSWSLDLEKIAKYAMSYRFPPLVQFLKEERLLGKK